MFILQWIRSQICSNRSVFMAVCFSDQLAPARVGHPVVLLELPVERVLPAGVAAVLRDSATTPPAREREHPPARAAARRLGKPVVFVCDPHSGPAPFICRICADT